MRIDEGREGIVLGPGSEIRDVPENKELLEMLERAPVLESEALLKLAGFYKAYPTNIPLGNHLALLALATRAGKRTVQEVFPEYDVNDWLEDFLDGASEDQEPADGSHDSISLFVRQIPISGIALVVETLVMPEKKHPKKARHFFIGVSSLA